MKVIENFGKLKDGRDALMLLDGETKKYVICHGYDPTLPEGQQWYWGSYYFEFANFVEDVYKANRETKVEDTKLEGFIFAHEDGTVGAWSVNLSKEDEEKISEILMKYEADGVSIRGDADDIKLSEVI